MRRTPIFLIRIVALLCMAAVLNLGLQFTHAAVENFHHGSHGDVATSDGGWIVASCDGAADQCTVSGHDSVPSADGHHHHGIDAPSGILVPAALDVRVRAPGSTSVTALPAQRLEDADIGRPGRVPRTSIRLA